MAESNKKPRALTDANVLFSGSAFPRWPYEVLRHALAGDIQLVLCPLVIDSARRHLRKQFPEHLDRFEAFLERAEYELVTDPSREAIEANPNLVRDLSDVGVALAAIAAKVDFLVSEDKDLTVQDETTAELRSHLKVFLSGTFLREVMGWSSDRLESIRHRKWEDLAEEEEAEAE